MKPKTGPTPTDRRSDFINGALNSGAQPRMNTHVGASRRSPWTAAACCLFPQCCLLRAGQAKVSLDTLPCQCRRARSRAALPKSYSRL